MSSSKRQTTAAKRDREQALRDKRARKEEKKQTVRDAKASGVDVAVALGRTDTPDPA